MSWEKVKLGDIADFSNGVNFGKSAYGKGIKLIGVSDFGNRLYPDYESLNEISSDVVRNNDYLKNNDIVFVRSNGNKELVGRCMLIKDIPERVTFSGFCIRARLKNTECHNPVYWTYHFKWNVFRQAMSGTANGANIQNLSQGRLAIYEALIPDIEIQNKIASILSSYDDLIENNQKQIKLLEEAAQRLYKEWFVDFRFPGHEQVQIIDGVPADWKKIPLKELIEKEIGGGWGEDTIIDKHEYPAYVVRGTDLNGLLHGNIKDIPYRYHAKSNLGSRELCDGDIIFEVSGGSKTEGVARTLLIRDELLECYDAPVMCASFCKLIRFKNKAFSQYMYDTFQYLRSSGKTAEYDKKSASSIVNYRWKDFLIQQEILLPSDKILFLYNSIAENLFIKYSQHQK